MQSPTLLKVTIELAIYSWLVIIYLVYMCSCTSPWSMVTVIFIQLFVFWCGPLHKSSYLFFNYAHKYFLTYSIFVWFGILIFVLVLLSFIFYLCLLISYQFVIKGVLYIMPNPNTSLYGVACNKVWYILCTIKLVSSSIPTQVLSSSRQLFCNSNVCTSFYMTW